MNTTLEVRTATPNGASLNGLQPRIIEGRDAGGGETLVGYAAVFGVETVIGDSFREQVDTSAFDRALSEGQDVRHLLNHDTNHLLGRVSSGTLSLTTDERGLRYSVALNPRDPDHQSVSEKVKRGDLSQSSFAFVTVEDRWENTRADELPLRTLLDVDLFDVSVVAYPAYPEADGVQVSG